MKDRIVKFFKKKKTLNLQKSQKEILKGLELMLDGYGGLNCAFADGQQNLELALKHCKKSDFEKVKRELQRLETVMLDSKKHEKQIRDGIKIIKRASK